MSAIVTSLDEGLRHCVEEDRVMETQGSESHRAVRDPERPHSRRSHQNHPLGSHLVKVGVLGMVAPLNQHRHILSSIKMRITLGCGAAD